MLVVVVLGLLGAAHSFQPNLEHFEQWALLHNKEYQSGAVRALRTLVWLDNAEFVRQLNLKDNGVVYKLNRFADLTHEEYKQTLSPISKEDVERVKGGQTLFDIPPWVTVPAAMDWRTKNAVTPVKNQGSCGSCYSFSTTGAVEGACSIKTGKLVALSEQQIMDCSWSYSNNGCNGGMFDRAFEYINKNGGIDTEASYPYTAVESHTCKYDVKNKGGSVSAFYYVKEGNEDALKQVIGMAGPVAIAINAGQRDFQFYHEGVYDNPACTDQLNHGVLAVGYGTDAKSGKDYFLVKNSWGTKWGADGYVKMRRNRNNQCGIASYPSIPIC